MAIKKLEEIRLNVQPVSIEFVHEYVFEGPCRFGKGDALTKPFDEMINEEKFQDWYTQLKAHMHEDVVNLLPPIPHPRNRGLVHQGRGSSEDHHRCYSGC